MSRPTDPTPPVSKAARKEAARAKADALRAEQARKEARVRRLTWAGVGVGVLVVVGLVLSIVLRGMADPEIAADVARPAGSTSQGGIQFGGSEAVAGQTNEGAVTVEVYLDYMCPYCGQFERMNGELLSDYVADGSITLELHPLAILDTYSQGTEYSSRAAAAFATVADQDPANALAFNTVLFDNQPEENTTGLTDEQLVEFAKQAGVPDAIAETVDDGAFRPWVSAATDVGTNLLNDRTGRAATPTIFIGGTQFSGDYISSTDALKAAIDEAIG